MNRHLILTVQEYRALPTDEMARAATITVVLATGEQVTVKNKWGAQAPLPAGAE